MTRNLRAKRNLRPRNRKLSMGEWLMIVVCAVTAEGLSLAPEDYGRR